MAGQVDKKNRYRARKKGHPDLQTASGAGISSIFEEEDKDQEDDCSSEEGDVAVCAAKSETDTGSSSNGQG
jgi:hypothetical protein